MRILMSEVHAPCIYGELQMSESEKKLHCSLVVQILWNALSNCVILQDDQELLQKRAVDLLSRWPQSYQKQARELFRKLKKNRRFVAVPLPQNCAANTTMNPCQLASRLAASQQADALLCLQGCAYCGQGAPGSLFLHDYATSPFCRERWQGEGLGLGEGEWTKREFEAAVWQPLFRYTTRVHIVDRYIGRSVIEGGSVGVKPAYARTIAWIAEQFAASAGPRTQSLEITCGITEFDPRTRSARPAADLRCAKTVLKRFGEGLQSKHGYSVTVNVKLERRAPQEVPHHRLLFTDQMSLQIDPGFDLLISPGAIGHFTMSRYYGRRADIERVLQALPNIN